MIVLFWSRATRDLLKVVRLGHRGTPSVDAATKLPFSCTPPHSILRSHTPRCWLDCLRELNWGKLPVVIAKPRARKHLRQAHGRGGSVAPAVPAVQPPPR